MNKDLLISFLNSLFNGQEVIRDVTYLNSENFGDGYLNRKAIFDVYCENEQGEKFIVEMQKAEQDYFKDRSIFYATFPIRERLRVGELCSGMQAPRGDWNFQLKAVYTVGILNFVFPDDEYSEECYHHEVKLMDTEDKHRDPPTMLSTSQAPFYDKLTFVYLEMPKFNKGEDELVTMFDKWLFVLRNLSRLLDRPAALQERIFTKLFEQAEIARFTPKERQDYEESIKVYRDLTNVVRTAERKGREKGRAEGRAEGRTEGREKGRAEGRAEIARNLKAMGMGVSDIAKATGLTCEEIEKLRL